jgi:hypothetical protein
MVLIGHTRLPARFKAKLGIFVTQDEYGKWWPVLQFLTVNEDQESFEWVFHHLLKILGVEEADGNGAKGVLDLIATDDDQAMAAAVESVLRIPHVLCQWHIVEKNLPKNMQKFCQGKLFATKSIRQ